MSNTVTFTLTKAEAHAVLRLAECAGNTYDDAVSVLVSHPKVRAAYRGIDKMNAALYSASARSAAEEAYNNS